MFTSRTESPISGQRDKQLLSLECDYWKPELACALDNEAMSETLWTFSSVADAILQSEDKVYSL